MEDQRIVNLTSFVFSKEDKKLNSDKIDFENNVLKYDKQIYEDPFSDDQRFNRKMEYKINCLNT